MAKEVQRTSTPTNAQIPDVPLTQDRPPLTSEKIGSYTAGPKGRESFASDQNVTAYISTSLAKAAVELKMPDMPVQWSSQELMQNAAQHGLRYDPTERVAISWDLTSKTPHLEVANRGSPLFNPLKYVNLSGDEIEPDGSQGYINPITQKPEENTHVGLQVALKLVDRIEYSWDFKGGDKVRAVARFAPNAQDESATMDAKLIPREGKERPIDLINPPDMGKAERFAARVFLKKA